MHLPQDTPRDNECLGHSVLYGLKGYSFLAFLMGRDKNINKYIFLDYSATKKINDKHNIPQTSAGGQDPESGREYWRRAAALE